MKRFLLTITAIFMGITAHAKTETINWYMDGNTYATTQCETGSDIILPQTPYKYGYTFNGWSTYIPIEYLESTGTQYIDTGVKPNQDTSVKTMFNITDAENYDFIYGSRSASKVNDFGLNRNAENGNFRFHYDTSFIETDLSLKKGVDYTVEQNKNLATINNDSFSAVYGNFNTPVTLVVFATKSGNTVISDYSKIKIYYFQIYENDVLVRDFIPVLDKDGVPCMYDKVEDKFYYNQGTGQFIAGPIINE